MWFQYDINIWDIKLDFYIYTFQLFTSSKIHKLYSEKNYDI